jgi:hypothetical protein
VNDEALAPHPGLPDDFSFPSSSPIFLFFQPAHHFPEIGAYFLYSVLRFHPACCQEIGLIAGTVF